MFGNATYMEGRVDNYQTLGGAITSEYLTRLMPLTVMVGDGQGLSESRSYRLWKTTPKVTPARSQAAIIALHSAVLQAIGFSHNT